ncbi:MAG: hypothetical protein Q9157_004839 [Trypethelium eluteriae]
MENLERRRTHNLLLISKLLNQRENVSPFTLLLDSLEQSASPLLQEYITRARLSKVKVVYVSYDSFRGPRGVDEFANAAQQEPMRLQKMLQTRIASIESHIPVISSTASAYSPPSLVLLKHLATTILTTRSLSHTVARKRARERSVAEPSFGIAEEVEGVITGLGGNDLRGLVFNMEHRRKSGRSMREWLVLHNVSRRDLNPRSERLTPGSVTLLEDHSLFRKLDEEDIKFLDQDQTIDSTFNLGLSERQRKDREGVVLPYFDAQKAEGVGEGGRILYDMGIEDDFDEEEDEI